MSGRELDPSNKHSGLLQEFIQPPPEGLQDLHDANEEDEESNGEERNQGGAKRTKIIINEIPSGQTTNVKNRRVAKKSTKRNKPAKKGKRISKKLKGGKDDKLEGGEGGEEGEEGQEVVPTSGGSKTRKRSASSARDKSALERIESAKAILDKTPIKGSTKPELKKALKSVKKELSHRSVNNFIVRKFGETTGVIKNAFGRVGSFIGDGVTRTRKFLHLGGAKGKKGSRKMSPGKARGKASMGSRQRATNGKINAIPKTRGGGVTALMNYGEYNDTEMLHELEGGDKRLESNIDTNEVMGME